MNLQHTFELMHIAHDFAVGRKTWVLSLKQWIATAERTLGTAALHEQGMDVTGILLVREYGVTNVDMYATVWQQAYACMHPAAADAGDAKRRCIGDADMHVDASDDCVRVQKCRRLC